MRKTIILLLLIALAPSAHAAGKVTTDPNAPGAAAAVPDDDLAPDSRLSKPVTICRLAKPVREVIAELSRQSGIVVKAGYNDQDWQVRDRKMSIFAKDVPLVQIMNSISRVMKFKWSRKGEDGKWQYRLYMDRRTLLDADAQRARAEAKHEADQARRRQKSLDLFCGLSRMSAEEKEKLKQDNPFIYATSDLGWGDSLGSFLREVPAAREALATGQAIQLEGGSLSPVARDGLINAMKAERAMEEQFSGGKPADRPFPENLDASKVTIFINKDLDRLAPEMMGDGMFLGEITYNYDGGSVSSPFVNPDSEIIKFLGKMMIECKQQNRKIDDVAKERAGELMAIASREALSTQPGEPEPVHPDDPALDVEINLQPETPYLPNVEQALSEASKLCVVSDYFPGMSVLGRLEPGAPGLAVSGEMELRTALEGIAKGYLYNWDKKAGVIELRDRNWFKKRAAQIPDAWLEKWKNELKKTGTVDIDNLAQIAQLTQEQFSANVMFDEDLALTGIMGSVYSAREFLRFYADLTPDQRAMLLTDRGLSLDALSPDQHQPYARLLETKGSTRSAAGERSHIKGTRRQAGKAFVYDFSLVSAGGSSTGWTVGTPVAFTIRPAVERQASPADNPKPEAGKPSTESEKPEAKTRIL